MKYFFALILLIFHVNVGVAQSETGLLFSKGTDQKGYVLFAPLRSNVTYLIDKSGNLVHSWRSEWLPAQSVYLLPDGSLLRTGVDTSKTYFPQSGGWIEKLDFRGAVIWSYLISDKYQRRHHDICPLENGNILVLVWEKKTPEEAIQAGRDPKLIGKSLWTEKIVEIKPKGVSEAEIVWEWKVWDHLVQDKDSTKKNFGNISESPGLINLNFLASTEMDWLHFNSIAYNKNLDQIIVSIRNFCEFIVLDHSTTTLEAASHKGGKSGSGGDLLYRWGNPRSYNRGTEKDQKLFSQHNVHWIQNDDDAQDKIMVFNNGLKRPGLEYSSVDVLIPPLTKTGSYKLKKEKAYLPARLYREYTAPDPGTFYSANISSAQQLPNGNILVCEGVKGKFFEIDKNNEIVWIYVSPYQNSTDPDREMTKGPIFRCNFYDASYEGIKKLLKEK